MDRVNTKSLRPLNDREDKFVDNYLDRNYRGELVRAYIDGGFSDGPKAGSNARQKLRDLRQHVIERMHMQIGIHVPWAFAELVDLAVSTKNEQVKLKCLQDILSRAGFDHPISFESKSDQPSDMSAKDIATELARLLQKAKPELKLVEGGKT